MADRFAEVVDLSAVAVDLNEKVKHCVSPGIFSYPCIDSVSPNPCKINHLRFMKPLSSLAENLHQSDIRAVTVRVNAVNGINLGQGICDMPAPDAIKEAARRNANTQTASTGSGLSAYGYFHKKSRWTTCTGILLLTIAWLLHPEPVTGQTANPTDEIDPVSINLEDLPYPHPVYYMEFTILGKDVRMAYMDVHPDATPAGTVVLLHGLNFFGEYWSDTIDALTEAGFRVVVPDQIGFGRSSKPVIPYSFQKKAANTRMLLDELGVEEAFIVGHSMGGMMATRFAYTYPEVTNRLVLVNMIGKRDFRKLRPWQSTSELYNDIMEQTDEEIREHQERYYVEWDDAYGKYIRIHQGWRRSAGWPRLAKVRALNRQMVYSQPVVYEFPHIEVPTYILSGAVDGSDFPELARRTCETIPDCTLTLIENVGHNPHFEVPDLFHRKLVDYLTGAEITD